MLGTLCSKSLGVGTIPALSQQDRGGAETALTSPLACRLSSKDAPGRGVACSGKAGAERERGRPGLGAAGGAAAGLAALGPAAGGGGSSLHQPAGAGWLGQPRPLPPHPTPAAAAAPGAGPGPSRCRKEPASGALARDRSRRATSPPHRALLSPRSRFPSLPVPSHPPSPRPSPSAPAPAPAPARTSPSLLLPAPPAIAPSRPAALPAGAQHPALPAPPAPARSSSSVSSSTSGSRWASRSPSAPGSPRARPESAARRRPPGHVRMEIRQHEWLSASPHEGFEQMRLKSRPKEPSPSLTRVGANFYSSVKQQDYSASVWLRRKDKLEHSQQKCIVIFALVCCFAILVALIFSAVDIMGEDEDGLSEKNCQNKCRAWCGVNAPKL
ncbi:serine/arginine repetitive matrix protein 1-like [Gorilla gorilla gorilla]|uniref:serine/arginine repetitive matrix protein 1-like n=1 Tax=Gorilla gorilla gorilla TaxID=9595 RepID=UPI00300998DC